MAGKRTMRVKMLKSMAAADRAYNEGLEYDVLVELGQEWIDKGFAIRIGE
jgi:hypothetical protein